MKKKIALLLAAVMTLSLMPTTIFASSTNKITRTLSSVPSKTALVFNSITPGKVAKSIAGANTLDRRNQTDDVIENYVTGSKLQLRLDASQTVTPDTAFRVQLDNAKWLMNLTDSKGVLTSMAAISAADISTTPTGATLGTIIPNTDSNTGYTFQAKSTNDIGYTLTVSAADASIATITIPSNWNNQTTPVGQASLIIPLSMYVEKEGVTVKAKVLGTANTSDFSSAEYVVVASTAGSTVTRFKSLVSGRERIQLDPLIIEETRVGSIEADGAIRLTAPSGYDFDNTPEDWTFTAEQSGVTFNDVAYRKDKTSDMYYLYFNGVAPSEIITGSIYISGMVISPVDNDNVPFGKTITMNVQKYAPNGSDTWTKLTINTNGVPTTNIKSPNASGTLGSVNLYGNAANFKELSITSSVVNCAKPVDWSIKFTAATPKELVAGRYDTYTASDDHLAAEVTFEEDEIGAWLSSRTTTFALPKGVKIRGIEYTDTTNIDLSKSTLNDLTANQLDGTDAGYANTQTKIVDGVATYTENTLTLKNVAILNSDDTTSLSFKLYLSIDPNFTGDTVKLTASGTAVEGKLESVVIAKVKRPITVTAKASEVQIGYQKFAVSDVTITENVAGGIKRVDDGSKSLKIALYDGEVSTDLSFNSITNSQITTTGDIKVSLDSISKGIIYLNVDRASTTPSTIKLTGLEVKVDRTVPYGSYDLVVFGSAVFANYELTGLNNSQVISPIVGFNTEYDGFTMKDYIQVGTQGTDVQKVNTFKVQNGSKTVIVNGETKTIEVAPYISKASNRFMLPIRFVANLLGVDDKNVFYDDVTKTATIILADRTVQFTTGSDIMKIASNGIVTSVKMDCKAENTDGRLFVPVKGLADAYGAGLSYDDKTQTATFN